MSRLKYYLTTILIIAGLCLNSISSASALPLDHESSASGSDTSAWPPLNSTDPIQPTTPNENVTIFAESTRPVEVSPESSNETTTRLREETSTRTTLGSSRKSRLSARSKEASKAGNESVHINNSIIKRIIKSIMHIDLNDTIGIIEDIRQKVTNELKAANQSSAADTLETVTLTSTVSVSNLSQNSTDEATLVRDELKSLMLSDKKRSILTDFLMKMNNKNKLTNETWLQESWKADEHAPERATSKEITTSLDSDHANEPRHDETTHKKVDVNNDLIKLIYNKYSDYEDEFDVDGNVVMDEGLVDEKTHEAEEAVKSEASLDSKAGFVDSYLLEPKVNVSSESFKENAERLAIDENHDLSSNTTIERAENSDVNQTKTLLDHTSNLSGEVSHLDVNPGSRMNIELQSNSSDSLTSSTQASIVGDNADPAAKLKYLNLEHSLIDNNLSNSDDSSSENEPEDEKDPVEAMIDHRVKNQPPSLSNDIKSDAAVSNSSAPTLEPESRPKTLLNSTLSLASAQGKISVDLEIIDIPLEAPTTERSNSIDTDADSTTPAAKVTPASTTMVNPQNPQFLECINACGSDHECVRNKCLLDSTYFG